MSQSNLTDDLFSPYHFNEFNQLAAMERYDLMSSIPTIALATACCYIDDKIYVDDLISLMTKNQQIRLKKWMYAIKQFEPNPTLITDIQQMIMQINIDFGEVSSLLTFLCDVVGIDFDDASDEDSDAEKQFIQTSVDTPNNSETSPLFSLSKLKEEIIHRKTKDKPKLTELVEIGANKHHYYADEKKLNTLTALAVTYPNFKDVIGQVRAAFQVSILTNAPLSLPVINLQGDPGIGKTQFVQALAKTLNLEFFSINVGSMNGRFELAGGNPQYGDADLGAIGQIMCFEAKSFQPVLLLDELCMLKDNAYDSIIQPLYSLFDREQRKSFKEHFLNIELDLSGALIFTTTNDFQQLKPALKSRLVNIDIQPPTSTQMRLIVQNIYENCLQDMKLQAYFNAKLSSNVVIKLVQFQPRKVIEIIRLAIGNSCVRATKTQRVELCINDFELINIKPKIEKKSKKWLVETKKNIH